MKRFCGGFLVLVFLASAVRGQDCNSCDYADRGDRHEGRRKAWKVSGESLELLGLHYLPPGLRLEPSDRLHLYFWLPATETPLIRVREPGHNYFMEPNRRPYSAGLQVFAWSRREVVDPLGLDPADFFSRVSNVEETVFFPTWLSGGAPPTPGGRYVFVVRSDAGLDVRCTVARLEPSGPVPVRRWAFSEELGGTVRLSWDGLDDRQQPVPRGRYVLTLRGDMLAESTRSFSQSYTFEHYGDLR